MVSASGATSEHDFNVVLSTIISTIGYFCKQNEWIEMSDMLGEPEGDELFRFPVHFISL